MVSEPRVLSSSMTYFHKFIVGPVWLAFLGVIFVALLRWAPRAGFGITFFILIVIVGAHFWTLSAYFRLKQVRMNDRYLYISNFSREIKIPLSNVREFSQSFFANPPMIKVVFKRETDFGRKILFTPKYRFPLWGPHPVLKEMEAALKRSKNKKG